MLEIAPRFYMSIASMTLRRFVLFNLDRLLSFFTNQFILKFTTLCIRAFYPTYMVGSRFHQQRMGAQRFPSSLKLRLRLPRRSSIFDRGIIWLYIERPKKRSYLSHI